MTGVSSSLMGRSSGRFSFVSEAESTIHHVPWIFTKLRPISKAAKFFRRMGHKREQCHHQPIANLTRSGKLGQGWRIFGLVDQGQSSFDENLGHDHAIELRARPHHQCEVLADLGEPGEVAARSNVLGGTPQLADRAVDRHGAHAVLQLGDVGVDVFERSHSPQPVPLIGASHAGRENPGSSRNAEHGRRA